MIAAAVIRQPYGPTIGHNVPVGAVGLSHRGSRNIIICYSSNTKSPFPKLHSIHVVSKFSIVVSPPFTHGYL